MDAAKEATTTNQVGLPTLSSELTSTYAIPLIYLPLMMIAYVAALLLRPEQGKFQTSPAVRSQLLRTALRADRAAVSRRHENEACPCERWISASTTFLCRNRQSHHRCALGHNQCSTPASAA